MGVSGARRIEDGGRSAGEPSPLGDLLRVPDSRRADLADIVTLLREARRVVLTTHVNADADGAGSQAAVAAWLESIGVEVAIINPTPFPEPLRFLLHREGLDLDFRTPEGKAAIEAAEVCLVLDTSEANRIHPLETQLDPDRTIVVDHHPAGPSVVGRGGVQDPTAAATGELVYDMISLSGDPWTAASTLGAYVAIVSDTGSFRFSNTTARCHAVAAEMLQRGVDPEEVFRRLFAVAPPRRIHLLREALARLVHDNERGLSYIVLPLSIVEGLQATTEDYEGLIDHARSIEGTRVAILFREVDANTTKISFRSSGPTDVNRIARQFGGGGHVKASGASINAPIAEAVPAVLAVVEKALQDEVEEPTLH
jgi:phosphoesterase RecJ-like protein